jgi:hypothetical protein
MNRAAFDGLMDRLRIGERYYALVDSIGYDTSVPPGEGVGAQDLKEVGREVFQTVKYDSRDKSIEYTFKASGAVFSCVSRLLKGSQCELGIGVNQGNEYFGNNLPVLAFEERSRNVAGFSRNPPYPRIPCKNRNELRQALSFIKEIERLLTTD